ncbi:MAG: hypothetical protein M3345_04185 [Actinomycetota bacterium]|nr:hypothetical protein [Actinomycetota bacterium]
MRSKGFVTLLALGALASTLFSPANVGSAPIGLDAQVVDVDLESFEASFPVIEYGRNGRRVGETKWRIVKDSGNCCENYVTTTSKGRVLDFGGSYINFSDDRGESWKSVRPIEPLINGEGAISAAPGGDIVGVQWDPYTGDHLLTFKYEAAEKKWLYNEMPIHQPFYDREWIGVVPGPITFGSITAPYVTFIKGAYPSKEAWYLSFDGLNYTQVSSKMIESLVTDPFDGYLDIAATPDFDWIQPNTNMGMAPIGKGRAIASGDWPFEDRDWSLFDGKDLRWSDFTFAEGVSPEGRMQVDSAGRLHNVIPKETAFVYQVSTDGGHRWVSKNVKLPTGTTIEEWDFRANKKVGVAAVGIHGHDEKADADVDLLYKFDISGRAPTLSRFYRIGKGDVNGGRGVGATVRFDFETLSIFPDGRIVMSFYDTTTAADGRVQPALAIEGATTFRR